MQQNLPPTVDEVIATGMAKDPVRRYATTIELANAARNALAAMPPHRLYTGPAPLGPTRPAVALTVPEKQNPSSPPPPPEPRWQQPTGSTQRSSIRSATVVPLVLTVVLLGAAAFAVTQFLRPYPHTSTAAPQWQPYVDYAKQFTVVLTSMSYQDPDSCIQRVLDGSTGQFHDDFAKMRADFKQTVANSKVVSQGTVNSAGLASISGTTAQVLVASTSKVTNTEGAKQGPKEYRLIVQVEKVDDTYKVSKVEFVP